MNSIVLNNTNALKRRTETRAKVRRAVKGGHPEIFSDIYHEDVNLAVWQRQFSAEFKTLVDDFVIFRPDTSISIVVSPGDARSMMRREIGDPRFNDLADDASQLVEMFCCLFDLEQAGLRMRVLGDSMCPKFHADRVPCRLITTYCGIATEWLPHHAVNRRKLGSGSVGQSDQESGLYKREADIQKMASSEVALLKGEEWQGNRHAGLVHRSPAVPLKQCRLLLTLDFSD